jgi:hypothetical protein
MADMKANELRIGNCIYFEFNGKSKTHIVVSRDINVMELTERVESESECFKSIPLTEEWLLKLGFERSGDYHNHTEYDNGELLLNTNGDKFYLFPSESSSGIKIQYVHQLQNLYFALKGEELIIDK